MKIKQLMTLSCLCAVALFAQSDRGTITGTVSDPANAVVPNAPVVARNADSGATYQTVTTATGNFTLASLPAGTYEVSVEAPGFGRPERRFGQLLV